MKFLLPTLAAAAVLTIATAQAQTMPPSGSAPGTPRSSISANVSSADRAFVSKAAQAGLSEVAEAKIALQRSARQDVKDFAQRMIDDHTKANDQLKQLAASEGLSPPTSPGAADKKQAATLSKESAASFDQDYIRAQRTAHDQAIALFTQESQHGQDPALKRFAAQTLPTLKEHDRMIKAMPLGTTS